jgi:hypothetical protein
MNTSTKRFASDIDIDFGDRTKILSLLEHTPASIYRDKKLIKHNTGVYVTDIPIDPFTGQASLDHTVAEDRGYLKLDFLNVTLYQQVNDETHLQTLMSQEPDWAKLYDREFCGQLIHIGNHYDTLIKMPEAVNSIPRMAMFLSVIRPAKRHLIGQTWSEIAKTVWEKPEDDSYYFKKAHAISYSHLVVVHMNLLNNSANQSNTSTL